jgi:excisionase family DNA binding protein
MSEYLTKKELMEELKMSKNTVYRLLQSGKLPAVKIGNEWRISRKALDAMFCKYVTREEVIAKITIKLEEVKKTEEKHRTGYDNILQKMSQNRIDDLEFCLDLVKRMKE